MNFRLATEKDAAKIADLLIGIGQLHHSSRPDIYMPNLQKYNESDIKEILKDENTFIFVVADENDCVAAYAFCVMKEVLETKAFVSRKYLYIDDFCVDPEYRKQHVGSFLMNSIKAESRKMGIEKIQLNVWEFNQGAIKFYENCGFKTQKREMEISVE